MEELYNTLFAHLEEKVQLQEVDKQFLKQFFTEKKLRRRQYLLQAGEQCSSLTFVAKGLLKSYSIDEKGNEHISLLAWEGWWISDFESFVFGIPAKLNIDALEASHLLRISKTDYEALLSQVPAMERYFRILYQNSLATKDARLISAHTHSAEEKYALFQEAYPQISQRIPQQLIASYLGLSPETISRIKRKLLEAKGK